ncbi:MAG TPA: NAD(P)/FAD-dependent oxidoreductase [Terriglobia bacterium]|nr:NAD(P)/FAD-dependent oxidoreductase [Terriglobia bacterium]
MRIAIVGAGPSGTWASILLARRGHSVSLIDSQAPWEKPCGGGVTAKALSGFGIFDSALPRQNIDRITIYFGDQTSVSVTPQQPVAVLSRRELSQYLLDEAEKAGVTILKSRIVRIEPIPGGWNLSARDTLVQSDFLIGADGATSLVRRTVGSALQPKDLSVTLGYFIPEEAQGHMKIYFLPSFEGYIWSFPRPNHVSYGLITRTAPGWTAEAKRLLSNFILADLGSDALRQAEFYSAPVPCLSPSSWKSNQISGKGWALIGDAAGLADPITGEGIYFAFKSAEILADTIERPDQYTAKVWSEIGRELARAAHMYKRFYRGRFFGGDFKKRTVQLSKRSTTLRAILGSLVAGNQSYLGLKKKLFFSIPSIGIDLITGR